MPIPPPPLPRRGTTTTDSPPSPGIAKVFPGPGRLRAGWRWTLTAGWVLVIYGLTAAGQAGLQVGKRPWWLGGGYAGERPPVTAVALAIAPYLLPVLAGVLTVINHRRWLAAGLVAVGSLAATAWLDVTPSPGVAAVEGLLAVVALFVTVAAIAGRMPMPRPGAGSE